MLLNQIDGFKTGIHYAADEPTGGSAEAGGTSEAEQTQTDNTISLTQEKLDGIIKEAYTRAYKKSSAELQENTIKPLENRLSTLQEQLEGLRPQERDGEQGHDDDHKHEGEQDRVIPFEEHQGLIKKRESEWEEKYGQLAKGIEDKDRSIQTLLGNQRVKALEIAAATHGAFDPSDVAKLLLDHVECDSEDGFTLYVRNEKGNKRINDDGDPMSVDEFVQEFLSKKKQYVRSDFRGGSGATGSGPGAITASLDKQIQAAEREGRHQEAIRLKRERAFGQKA